MPAAFDLNNDRDLLGALDTFAGDRVDVDVGAVSDAAARIDPDLNFAVDDDPASAQVVPEAVCDPGCDFRFSLGATSCGVPDLVRLARWSEHFLDSLESL